MFFKFEPFQGPASFSWKDPDTGRDFVGTSKDDLISKITSYRSQNNLEVIDHLGFVLENYWCSLPENFGKCTPVGKLGRGLLGYFRGGIALIKNLWYGDFATQMEADRRSKQCVACPYNTFLLGPDHQTDPGFINWSNDIAVASIGERRSKHHDKLGQCGVCSCPLRAKVFWTGEVPADPEWIPPMESVNCWQLGLMKRDGK